MRPTFGVLILLVVSRTGLATPQAPDLLQYADIEMKVHTDWAYLSPLETYYYENRLEYPFVAYSTGNYRGHVAVWKIRASEFYLSEIRVDGYVCDPTGGYKYVIESHEPNEYGVVSRTRPASESGEMFADWFSGILDCYVKIGDAYVSYLFQIRDGNVVDTQIITSEDYDILSEPATRPLWSEALKAKYRMLILNDNYVTYYYRLSEDDEIEYEGQNCRLATGYERRSPLFVFYGDRHLNWPYNWENLAKCGAPHCRWRIEDDKLCIAGIDLYSGLSYYSIDTEELDLTTLFGERVVDGVVDANWVSGVYRIKHGYATQEDAGWPGYTFTVFNVTGYTYVRIEQGRLTESYTVPKDFNPANLPDDADPGLIRIIEDYRLPSVFGTSSAATDGGTDQGQNSPEGGE
ncbi:MAG TPA: hypothetical protein PLU87_12610 [Sedimentisphaerales bacterium]|nr:hypothetical protein [Sedimentisphaerales bacterium]HRS11881.1 hypothetical protein [Sedimentisphaerales bacterium]HRV48558.1 hypothetical protein [Sedimentisphaerales bacterium]